MGSIINFVVSGWKTLLLKIGIVAIVFLAGLGIGYHFGGQSGKLKEANEQVQVAKDVDTRKADQAQISNDTETKQLQSKKKIYHHYATVQQKIDTYKETPEAKQTLTQEQIEMLNAAVAKPEDSASATQGE